MRAYSNGSSSCLAGEHCGQNGETNLSGGSPTNYAINTYDLADRLIERLFGNGTKLVREYDDANRVTRDAHFLPPVGGNPAVAFEDRRYGRDAVGNRTWLDNLVKPDFSEWYGYDTYDRLRDFKRGTLNTGKTDVTAYTSNVHVTQRQQWSGMDVLGNWLTTLTTQAGITTTDARTHNDANEIMTRDLSTNGSPSGSPVAFAHDHNGSMTNDGQFLYDYDVENRLTRARRILPGSPPPSQIVGEYYYDAIGRRVRKVVSNCGEGQDGDFKWAYSFRWQIVQVASNIGTGPPMVSDLIPAGPRAYLDDNVAAIASDNSVSFLHSDGLFTPTAFSTGAAVVSMRCTTDPYGHRLAFDGQWAIPPSVPEGILFTLSHHGVPIDRETGNHFNRVRIRNTETGRFSTRDPWHYADGPSMYGFVGSRPMNRVDPFGLIGCTPDPVIRLDPVNNEDNPFGMPRDAAFVADTRCRPPDHPVVPNDPGDEGPNPWEEMDTLTDQRYRREIVFTICATVGGCIVTGPPGWIIGGVGATVGIIEYVAPRNPPHNPYPDPPAPWEQLEGLGLPDPIGPDCNGNGCPGG